jgi:hypothetical protein
MHAVFNGLGTFLLFLALLLGGAAEEPRTAPLPGVERHGPVEKEKRSAGNVDTLPR